jgi:hypothetical protein
MKQNQIRAIIYVVVFTIILGSIGSLNYNLPITNFPITSSWLLLITLIFSYSLAEWVMEKLLKSADSENYSSFYLTVMIGILGGGIISGFLFDSLFQAFIQSTFKNDQLWLRAFVSFAFSFGASFSLFWITEREYKDRRKPPRPSC